jgi:hypothetical protein
MSKIRETQQYILKLEKLWSDYNQIGEQLIELMKGLGIYSSGDVPHTVRFIQEALQHRSYDLLKTETDYK